MPKKPKRPCFYPGCPELTDNMYCERHKSIVNKNYNKYERDPGFQIMHISSLEYIFICDIMALMKVCQLSI